MTPKQTKFIEEYLIDFNATQAAIRAGYSPKTAYSTGQENLKKPVIQEAISGSMPNEYEIIGRIAKIARGEHEDGEISHEIKTLDMLAKAHGLYDKDINQHEVIITKGYAVISPDDL